MKYKITPIKIRVGNSSMKYLVGLGYSKVCITTKAGDIIVEEGDCIEVDIN